RQSVSKLVLGKQHQLQKLGVVCFVVDELAKQLKKRGPKRLSLINDQDHGLALLEGLLNKKAFEALVCSSRAKLLRDRAKQAVWRGVAWVGQQNRDNALVQEFLVEESSQRRLACAGIAEDNRKALLGADDIGRLFKRCRMN